MTDKNYSHYLSNINSIIRHWMMALTPCEISILLFINERTYRYKKSREIITIKQFMEGIRDNKGEIIQCGIPYKRSTIIDSYRKLLLKGLISISPANNNGVNFFEINCKILKLAGIQMMKNSKLKIPKKRKNIPKQVVQNLDGVVHILDGGCRDSTPIAPAIYINNRSDYKRIDLKRTDPAFAGAAEKVEKAKTRYRERRKQKASSNQITLESVKAKWQEVFLQHYPDTFVISITRKEYAIFKKGYQVNKTPLPLFEFIEWSISKWDMIRQIDMSWVKNMPKVPTFSFFAYMYKYFCRAYNEVIFMGKKEINTEQDNSQYIRKLEKEISKLEKELDHVDAENRALRKSRKIRVESSSSRVMQLQKHIEKLQNQLNNERMKYGEKIPLEGTL